MAHPRDFGLANPDDIGASEYRAIYDLLADALAGCEDVLVGESPGDYALAILDEVDVYATEMRALIVAAGVAETA